MNQKIPFHKLAKRLSLATSISNESAEVFIKNFFDLLSEAIVNGETVKIKGLGTFSHIESGSNNCVEFTPDKEIADTLNAPFSPFEAVELNDDVSDEMLQEINETPEPVEPSDDSAEKDTPEEAKETEIATEETVEENPENIEEATVEPEVTSESESAVVQEPIAAQEPTVPPTLIAPEPIATPEPIVEPEHVVKPEPAPEPIPIAAEPEPTPAPTELIVQIPAKVVAEKPTLKPALEEEPEEFVEHVHDDNQSGNGSFGWGFLVGLLVGLALGACAVYLAIDYLFPNGKIDNTEQITETEPEATSTEEILLSPEPTDTVNQQVQADSTVTTQQPTVSETENQAVASAAPQAVPVTSKAVKDTVRRGYSLTHMAKKHYGSKDFWVYIYEENKGKIKNPNKVQPGEVFVIPAPEKYGINASSSESISNAKSKAGQILSKFS